MVADAYARGTALDTATSFEIDDVIDPAATRDLVAAVILTGDPSREARKRGYVDAW
jgi:methylmalonyl-CoA carboxyltransferase 12S subunit